MLRLPSTPLVSILGQEVVALNTTNENNTEFTVKEVLAPAKPLSVILSSNKINVESNNSTHLDDSTAFVAYTNGTMLTQVVRNTAENTNSNHAEGEMPFSINKNDYNQDLSKEPRIDISQKTTKENTNTKETDLVDASFDSQPSDEKDNEHSKPHVIPTFYNPKVQVMYSPTNDSNSVTNSSLLITSSSENVSLTDHGTSAQITDNKNEQNSNEFTHKNVSIKIQSSSADDERTEGIESYTIPQNQKCGKLGGAAIFQAFGKVSQKLMPNLVASWVTGQSGSKTSNVNKRARIELSGEFDKHGTEPRIIAGKIVLYIFLQHELLCTSRRKRYI